MVLTSELPRRASLVKALTGVDFAVDAPASGHEADALLTRPSHARRLLVVDLSLKGVEIVDFIRQGARRWPMVAILALSEDGDDARILAAIRAGAHGCLFHDEVDADLVSAAEDALAGGRPVSRRVGSVLVEHLRNSQPPSVEWPAVRPLTPREKVVLQQLARGFEYEDIGRVLGVSLNTVRSYVRAIYDKLDVNSRTEAVLVGMKLGLVTSAPPVAKQR